jgi:hypothetical protein
MTGGSSPISLSGHTDQDAATHQYKVCVARFYRVSVQNSIFITHT